MKRNEKLKVELEPPTNDGPAFSTIIKELFGTQDGNIDLKSPEKPTTSNGKRCRMDALLGDTLGSTASCDYKPFVELGNDQEISEITDKPNPKSHVSLSATSFRRKLLPPPCIRNPLKNYGALFPALTTDFQQIEEIGSGNSSNVFKVLSRVDGCLYAVKRSIRKLCGETDRTKALVEVQALAALGSHKNIVRYYSSWFENEHLYVPMELCDHSLFISNCPSVLPAQHEVEALYQVASALNFIHEKGIAHLDVKLENIYVKNGVYKLGDFGCAAPCANNLDKVDIFSLGVSMFELITRLRLLESEILFSNLNVNVPLLPEIPVQFQNLLEVMMDPDPVKRPSAAELVERVLEIRNN